MSKTPKSATLHVLVHVPSFSHALAGLPTHTTKNMLATLTIYLHLPTCSSLKEKRGRIKPLIARLHREFNVSVAEMDKQDNWQEVVIICAMVNSDATHLQRSLQTIAKWVEGYWPDGDVIDQKIEYV